LRLTQIIGAIRKKTSYDALPCMILQWPRHGEVINNRFYMCQMSGHMLLSQVINIVTVTVHALDQP